MSTTTKQIQDYLYDISKGVINVSPSQANRLIDIAINGGYSKEVLGTAKLHQYLPGTQSWKQIRIAHATDKAINIKIKEFLAIDGAPMDLYRWDCYNSDKQLEGLIYTANITLF